jgi:hypothetical protein
MALSEVDKDILEQIVESRGECLKAARCKKCPFRAMCLPEFLSESQRLKMAMDILTHHYLIDEEVELEDIERDYGWDRN